MAMNTEQQVSYSIEGIRERRLAKREELKLSKGRMQDLTQQLFAPQQGKNKIDSLMQQVNMGIAAYDGLMTGIKNIASGARLFCWKKEQTLIILLIKKCDNGCLEVWV